MDAGDDGVAGAHTRFKIVLSFVDGLPFPNKFSEGRYFEICCCFSEVGGISISGMFAKKVAVYSVLSSISLSLANVGLLVSLRFPTWSSFELASCPMRSERCCCPEVCPTPENKPTEKHVHQERASHAGQKSTGRSSSSVCILKAGCVERDSFMTSSLFQKESLLRQGQVIATIVLKVSFLLSDPLFHTLPGYSPSSFHPPRSS